MEYADIEGLVYAFHNRLAATQTTFHRSLASEIRWQNRLIGIKGPKGVGKTTLLLQHIKETYTNAEQMLYVSLDNLWFSSHELADLVRYFYMHGGRYLFLDEVHHYRPWQLALKNFYDDYPDLNIVYSGSSMLQIDKGEADLSRRMVHYALPGLSFREYLEYEGVITIPKHDFSELLSNHVQIAMEVKAQIPSIQSYFETYLKQGYYPFYKEDPVTLYQKLVDVSNHILEVDYPMIDDIEYSTVRKVRKMLMVLAERVPQTPNMNELYAQLETGRSQGIKMLYALERAGLLALLADNMKNLKALGRPAKIFLDNSNLMYALGNNSNIGTIRETFFFNQVRQQHPVCYAPKGDFLVDGTYYFEVGGANKSFEQIKDEPNGFLAVDNTEVGHGNRIPLWMFGLLY